MKTGLTISTVGHLALLVWGLVAFSARPFEAAPVDSLPVDIVSASEFSQLMAGAKNAPKSDTPKPVVDKIDEPKPPKDPTPKASDKPEITTASAEKTPPLPEQKPDKREKAESDPKVDPVADLLKHEAAKKPEPPKKAETPVPPKKPPPPQPRFDANKIAALLDKRDPRRETLTGATLNQTATLGAPTGTAMALSQSELDALRAQIQACWNPPVGVADAKGLVVTVRLMLKQDGSLSAEPLVTNRGSTALFQIAAESALRAIRRCAPYRLPIAKYEVWKDVEVDFDPRDMFRG
jgi:outer membrane biosynthesis protein TonB